MPTEPRAEPLSEAQRTYDEVCEIANARQKEIDRLRQENEALRQRATRAEEALGKVLFDHIDEQEKEIGALRQRAEKAEADLLKNVYPSHREMP